MEVQITITVLMSSWLINAAMDAIDHGKGAGTLKGLWHVLKWLSYAIPYGYIIWLTAMPIPIIIVTILCMWLLWETLYRYLRHIDFHTWDK